MSFRERAVQFLNRNVVLITGCTIIVATHWGWSKLQQNPALVPPEKRIELPIVTVGRKLKQKMVDEIDNIRNPKPESADKPT